MAKRGSTSASSAQSATLTWTLVTTMAIVVVGFLSAFVTGRVLSRSMSRDLDSIADEAMPRVVILSSARGDLRRLNDHLRAATRGASFHSSMPTDAIDRDEKAIDDAVRRYGSVGALPGGSPAYDEVLRQLSALDASVRGTLAAARGGDLEDAVEARADERRVADDLDDTLERLAESNASSGQTSARAITSTRQHVRAVMVSLDAIALVLALASTTLAVIILRRSVGLLEDKNRELDQFSGRVAHDVLGPAGTVHLALDLLARRFHDDPATGSLVQRAQSGLRRLRTTVEDLLEFARSGARPEPSVTTELSTALAEAVEAARPDAIREGVELTLGFVEPCALPCSRGVLSSLVGNLTRNAISHMGDSSVRRIEVRVVVFKDRRRVEVVDTGPGVPSSLRQSIFEPFVRGDTRPNGVGLGLATVRRLAEAHGGRAEFRPSPGGGSVFWFDIPVARPRRFWLPTVERRSV
jgi:signal transduction histidine kinase